MSLHDRKPVSAAWILSANLARLEGKVVFDRLVRPFADIHWLDTTPEWRGTLVLRGVHHLNAVFTRATAPST